MKIIDFINFINDYSGVFIVGIMVVAFVTLIIFKAIEIHKLSNILYKLGIVDLTLGNHSAYLEDIRRFTRSLGDIDCNIEQINKELTKKLFQLKCLLEKIDKHVYDTNDLTRRRAEGLSEIRQNIKCLIEQATYIEDNIEKTAKQLKKIRKEGSE